VREDEEQKIKLQEITDLLVAAGYFRARIKGLSSFDKVMCKCNERCSKCGQSVCDLWWVKLALGQVLFSMCGSLLMQ
jgi:ArsR family metal-binding transcriptional regulator